MLSRVQIEATAFNNSLNEANASTTGAASILINFDNYNDTTVIEFPEKAFNQLTLSNPAANVQIQVGSTTVSLPISLLKKYAPTETGKLVFSIEKHFTDLTAHWAKSDLELLASKLIINGISNDVFAPDQEISRAQFAALLIRSLGLQSTLDPNAKSKFKDIKSSDWFAAEVQIAASKGLIDGYEDGSFRPLASITREQMATMIYRAQKLVSHISDAANLDSVLTKYTDQEKVGTWARNSLAATLQDGLKGYRRLI
jgi:hypothetical protein